MVTCEVCGGEDFDKHDGFLYCSVCLTQSQDYYEQQYDYQHHEVSTTRTLKKRSTVTKSVSEAPEDGSWTSWEAFNYILYGMTQEMKKCGAEDDFEIMVLKIWAAYLQKCDVAFISRNPERLPKLGLPFKSRDARILYKVDVPINFSVEKKRTKRSSRISSASNLSLLSKRSYSIKKSKIIAADYQEHLSNSISGRNTLADETLESLKTSTEGESSEETVTDTNVIIRRFRQIMKKKDYKRYKNSYQSSELLANAKTSAESKIHYLGKNKLLSMIHLALLVTRSKIQLSDLLRFIREGHLSYAKVTHFFPSKVKLPKKDSTYIDVISDSYMPTHLRQRKITGQLGYMLKMGKIPVPKISLLIERYCSDLNLPDEISKLSKKLRHCWPSTNIPKSKSPLSSFEAWAMACIIFIMKLLFGMNDQTEILFSRLATVANGLNEGNVFEFEDWQKYIECRKSILMEHHYPTQEQLNDSSCTSSKLFLEMLMKESKDENRSKRFIPYANYYMSESLVSGIKNKLDEISTTQNFNLIDFKPSLTPQTSHLEAILNELKRTHKLPEDLLGRKFKDCDVKPFLKPENFLADLKEKNADLGDILGKTEFNEEGRSLVINCASNYWILEYPTVESGNLINFKEEILEKTPRNFQWLLGECARMLEMNMRDIYDELLRLEKNLQPGAKHRRKNQ